MVGIGLWLTRPWTGDPPPILSVYESVHSRCLYAVQSRMREVTWPAPSSPKTGDPVPLLNSSIVVRKLPMERIFSRRDNPVPLPCIIITPQRVMAPPTQGLTSYDDYLRPVLVTIVMSDNAEPTLQLNLDVITMWLEMVEHAFQNQRLAGVVEVINASVEPAETIIPSAWGSNVLAAAVLLRFVCREPRGLNL
jgi:hypothetical protein